MDASNRPSVDGCVIDDLKINKFSRKNFDEKCKGSALYPKI